MTNLFAFTMYEAGVPYVFSVADAQATFTDAPSKSGDALKLVKRGGALLSLTGSSEFQQAYADIDDSPAFAEETARKLLQASESMAKNHEGPGAVYVVAGFDPGFQPAIYAVHATDSKDKKRGIRRIQDWKYANGSGSQKVEPAIEREIEEGMLILPGSRMDAMLLCFRIGSKADQNLYVNDKLQIGMVSPQGARAIIHPEIKAYGREFALIYNSLSGEDMTLCENMPSERRERITDIVHSIDELYIEIDTCAKRVLHQDRNANFVHSLLKKGVCTSEDYEKAHMKLGKEVHEFSPLVDAFTSADMTGILTVLRDRCKGREERYKRLDQRLI